MSLTQFLKTYGDDPDNMLDVLAQWPITEELFSEMFPGSTTYSFPHLLKDENGFIVNVHGSYERTDPYDTFDLSRETPQVIQAAPTSWRDREVEDVVSRGGLTCVALDLNDSPRSSRLFRMSTCHVFPKSIAQTVVYDVMYYTDYLFKLIWRYLLHTVFGEFGENGIDDFIISKVPDSDGCYHVARTHRRAGFTALSNMVRLFAQQNKDKLELWRDNLKKVCPDKKSAVHLEYPHVEFELDDVHQVLHIQPLRPSVHVHFLDGTDYPPNGPLFVMKEFVEAFYDKLRVHFPIYQRLEVIYKLCLANRVKGCVEAKPVTLVPIEDHADNIALHGGIRLVPRTVVTRKVTYSPKPVVTVPDPVVNVKVARRALSMLPGKVGSAAHSALLVTTSSGQQAMVEYLGDGRVHVTHSPDLATWSAQATGEQPDKHHSIDSVANLMTLMTASKQYHLLFHNCHMAQENTRRAMGLHVKNAY